MFFGLVFLFTVIWLTNCFIFVKENISIKPITYDLTVISWCLLALPAAFRISFGG